MNVKTLQEILEDELCNVGDNFVVSFQLIIEPLQGNMITYNGEESLINRYGHNTREVDTITKTEIVRNVIVPHA